MPSWQERKMVAFETTSPNLEPNQSVSCGNCVSLLRLTYAILDIKTGKILRILVCRDCGEIRFGSGGIPNYLDD
jgi:hypothetical protein